MKKIINLIFAFAMMFSIVFIGDAINANGNLSVQAQQKNQGYTTGQEKKGVIRKTYAGGKYVVRKTWNGTKWVSRKVWNGTKRTGRNTKRITKKVFRKTKKVVY
jgi:hypothetical protein